MILIQADRAVTRGFTIRAFCRKLGIWESTLLNWRRKYGGLTTDQACRVERLEENFRCSRDRLKEVEEENDRLRDLLAQAELDKDSLRRRLGAA